MGNATRVEKSNSLAILSRAQDEASTNLYLASQTYVLLLLLFSKVLALFMFSSLLLLLGHETLNK